MHSTSRPRIIPCLLLRNSGLVKTRKFRDPTYLGDPRNVVKIFNDKEADELVLLDISATPENRKPQLDIIREIASECFMPLGYGGGVRSVADVQEIIGIGLEKVIINTAAIENPKIIEESAKVIGSQSVVASIDVKAKVSGEKYEVFIRGGRQATGMDPVIVAKRMEDSGAGEILINSMDRDGMMDGYDIDLISSITCAVRIPVIACGGAGKISDLVQAGRQGGASAAAAGSMFVFHGKLRAVLISFPTGQELRQAFSK